MSTLLQLEIFGIYLRTQLLSAISFIMLFRFYKKKKKRYDERVSDLSSGISTISFSHQNGFRRRGRKPHFLYFEEGEEANDVSTCSFKTKRQERCHDHHISKKYMNSIKKFHYVVVEIQWRILDQFLEYITSQIKRQFVPACRRPGLLCGLWVCPNTIIIILLLLLYLALSLSFSMNSSFKNHINRKKPQSLKHQNYLKFSFQKSSSDATTTAKPFW